MYISPWIFPPAGGYIDVPAAVSHIATKIRRIVTLLDPHKVKEQVSETLIFPVERLHYT